MEVFDKNELKHLYRPAKDTNGEDNGQVTIIGGSELFHGAPLFALTVASRIVDMVFFATPEKSVGHIAEHIKSKLFSFIWVPWEETEKYIEKSDAVLIGPGFMRYKSESSFEKAKSVECDDMCLASRDITHRLLTTYRNKKWVIDAGSLQTMDAEWIPENSVLTPNKKEFELLFNLKPGTINARSMAQKYKCTIVLKGPETTVCSPRDCVIVKGGNPGMTKGGTGDVLAGLTVALLAKNDAFLSAKSASFIAKTAADELYKEVGVNYNSDDLAAKIPRTLQNLLK